MALSQSIKHIGALADVVISPDVPNRIFKVRIENETLKLVETKLKEGTFESDFQWILKDASESTNVPSYYLINTDVSFNEFILITYVPELAVPTLKMQYAYCQNTLKKKLHWINIKSTLFASKLEELTHAAYLESISDLDNTTSIEAESEEQNHHNEFHSSFRLPGMQSISVAFSPNDDVKTQLRDFPSSNKHCIAIGMEKEAFSLIQTWEGFPSTSEILTTQPCYLVSKKASPEEYTFVYMCPENVKIQEKMISASAKQSLFSILQEYLGLKITKEEVQTPDDAIFLLSSASVSSLCTDGPKNIRKPKPPGRPRTLVK